MLRWRSRLPVVIENNGDGFRIYVGSRIGHDGAIRTVRLEIARECVEDYEYLYQFKSLIDQAQAAGHNTSRAEQALTTATELVGIPNAVRRFSSKILPEPKRLAEVRTHVANAIELLE